ncbi:lysophospholipid acyltransferase family protein [Myxococcaceae bacterium GXIMD 01537]
MKYLVSFWFWFVFLTTAPLCTALGAVLWLLSWPVDRARRALHWMVTRWCYGLYMHAWPGWSVHVEGRELLPPGPCVLVSNHQSVADIFALMGLRHQFKFVAKASLFSVPMVGWLMSMMGYVRVVRRSPTAMTDMLEDCRHWLRQHMSVLIFPEGTYAADGVLLPFKRGAFKLALEERVPVVPVLIQGTTDLVVGDGPWLNPRARMRIRVLPPVPVEAMGADEVALAERVRGLFLAALTQEDRGKSGAMMSSITRSEV